MAYPKNIIPKLTLVQDKRSKIWQVAYTNPKNGMTYRRSTGSRDKTEAQKLGHALAAELTGLRPSGPDYKIGELLAAYRASKETVGESTVYALAKLEEHFSAFKPDQLGPTSWTAYRRWRTAQHHSNAASPYQTTPKRVSDSTAVRELGIFRAAIRWAQSSPHWPGLQHVRVSINNAPQTARQQFLTRDQAKLLIDGCVELHQRLFVRIALATGARHRAILGLKWSDVTWPQGDKPMHADRAHNIVHASEMMPGVRWGVEPKLVDFSKGTLRKAIYLDLGADVGRKKKPVGAISVSNSPLYGDLLAAYQRRTTDRVIEWRGSSVERIDLSDAYRRAGLKRPQAPQHVLKHTAISWMVQEGRELAKIAAFTRTSMATIEKVYGHLSPHHHEETAGELFTIY